jgi:hypothetical protein
MADDGSGIAVGSMGGERGIGGGIWIHIRNRRFTYELPVTEEVLVRRMLNPIPYGMMVVIIRKEEMFECKVLPEAMC